MVLYHILGKPNIRGIHEKACILLAVHVLGLIKVGLLTWPTETL